MSIVLAIYLIVVLVLSAYGLHQGILVVLAWRGRGRRPIAEAPVPRDPWPFVTVQVPLFNERFVAERIIRAVSELDYPTGRWEIQVLDDSTDETVDVARQAVEAAARQGVPIAYFHRKHRRGYKAGALASGLEQARGELVAIFDADFVPARDFLQRVVPEFGAPGAEKLGFVQTRWSYLNRDENLLTRAQATMHDMHFFVEQPVRSGVGLPFNFNGSGGIWRRACIDDAGGWQIDTLTEDLDLSYRAKMHGWRGLYRIDIPAPNELPSTLLAFKRQQTRWARGSIQTARKLARDLIRSALPLRAKVSGLIHMTGYGLHPMLLTFMLLWPVLVLEPVFSPGTALRIPPWLSVVSPLGLSFVIAMAMGQRAQQRPKRELFCELPVAVLIGIGVAFSNTVAVLQGLLVRATGEFERTPKDASRKRARPSGYRVRMRWTVVGEIVMGLYQAAAVLVMWRAGLGSWAVPAGIYATAFFLVVAVQLREMLAIPPPSDPTPLGGAELVQASKSSSL